MRYTRVYRRHTNFSIESIENTFNGSCGFNKRVTCQISRNGDLIHRMYLQTQLPALSGSVDWVDYVGLRLLRDVEIEIGGQRIDKHYPQWLYVWNQLTLPVGKRAGYDLMTGEGSTLNTAAPATTLYIPLEFWFNRNVGLSLPLIALQYHEVKINIDFEAAANLVHTGNASTGSVSGDLGTTSLWVDYIYLDTDERRRFAQLSHEYLIEQLQFTGVETINQANPRVKLNFNHPVKELVWAIQPDSYGNQWTNFTAKPNIWSSGNGVNAATWTSPFQDPGASNLVNITANTTNIQLNGQDRFNARDGNYFSLVQPFQHHENVPANRGINVYSFALKPEEHQPSGTLNMSRIDTAVLKLDVPSLGPSATGSLYVFAVNYNVLRIMSGMGGLAYSN